MYKKIGVLLTVRKKSITTYISHQLSKLPDSHFVVRVANVEDLAIGSLGVFLKGNRAFLNVGQQKQKELQTQRSMN